MSTGVLWPESKARDSRAFDKRAHFAQVIVGTTVGALAKVAKPQSAPAITFSRPTTAA